MAILELELDHILKQAIDNDNLQGLSIYMMEIEKQSFLWQYSIPFTLLKHQKHYLQSLDQTYKTQSKSHLFTPLSDRGTIINIMYLLNQLQVKTDKAQFFYLVESKRRKLFVLQLAQLIHKKYFNNSGGWLDLGHTPNDNKLSDNHQINRSDYWLESGPALKEIKITSEMNQLYKDNKLLVIATVQQYAEHQLYQDNTNTANFVLIQTAYINSTLSSMIEDYITDTYIRRAYIQACKLQEGYKKNQKPKRSRSNDQKKPQLFQLISLLSKDSSHLEESPGTNQNKGIFRTYQQKKHQLKAQSKGVISQQNKYQKNELILISLMIYILGYLQSALVPRKPKSLKDFFEQFQNKTLLLGSIFEEMPKYLKRILKNCQFDHPYKLQNMYLYHIWEFLKKIQIIRNLYPNLQEKGVIVKFEKMTNQKNQCIIEQSVNCMRLALVEPKKIIKILQAKILNFAFVQNLKTPQSYIKQCFNNRIIVKKPMYDLNNIYGVHISKTPSNQDIQFTKNSKNVTMNIKMKACGVLLYELSQFVPDGMIVYFYSPEGLSSFLSMLSQEDEKILSKLDNTKKIFVESQFEAQNIKNIAAFQKCCNIGKGAIYFLSAGSNMAKYHQFYRHYSNCIVFIGLPRDHNEKQDDGLKKQETQIPILLRCLNNCINDITQAKSVIFVGREINTGLDKWLQFVHIWDETARVPLEMLRKFYKNSQKIKKQNLK